MYRIKTFLILAFLVVLPVNSAFARIDILPRIVVLDSRERSAEITILNLFDQPSLYRLSLIHYKQNPDGTYEELEQPLSPNFDPEQHVRISPKQFKVNEGGRQKIRLSVRRPADLPDGEYRFHLIAKRFETADQSQTPQEEGASISLKINVAVAIPIVIRQGDTSVEAKIGDFSYVAPSAENNNRHELSVTINRSGTAGSVGKLEVFRGDERIGYITNFNIFSEVDYRTIGVPIGSDPRGQGALRIVYSDNDDNVVYDEKTVQP